MDSLGSPERDPSTFGRELTTFVGRSREIAELTALLDTGIGFVTLWGPAGIGKTRLADRVLWQRRALGEKTHFCDLRDVHEPRGICEALARSLLLRISDTDSLEQLVSETGEGLNAQGPCVVVLDNFEQLVDVAALVLPAWLRGAPKARFVVTSRRILRLTEERLYELGPLPLPESPTETTSDAVLLFAERARNVEPSFDPDQSDPGDLVELVRLLSGRPLALELGAGLMRRRTVREAIDQVGASLLSLRSGRRNRDPRHDSLAAAIQSSWDLLSAAERRAMVQLTVFRSGFTLDAASAVIDCSSLPDAPSAADLVEGLRESSLLRAGGTDRRRWDMYEATREASFRKTHANPVPGPARRAAALGNRPIYSTPLGTRTPRSSAPTSRPHDLA